MRVKINGVWYTWYVEHNADGCCGCNNPHDLSVDDRPISRWDEQLRGDFPDFCSAFLFSLSGNTYTNIITDCKGGMWDTHLFAHLAKSMTLSRPNKKDVIFDCSFSGWHRNPNTGNMIQAVTIVRR